MNALEVLEARGFVHQTSDRAAVLAMLERPVTVYTGFDATARSLHVGHLVQAMQLAWLQRYGHRPIVLCGGGTTLVGDPTGKTESRPILTHGEINANVAAQRQQLMRFLDFSEGQAFVVNNADWLCRLNYIEFLRDFGAHFSVNQMLATEIYRERLANDQPLSFLEFNYQLLQAYDFLHLYREYGCTLQASGSDQWANCLAGRDLIRRVEGADAHVLTSVLLLTSDGRKMGKTEAGAVYLDPELTPPYDFYQYWVNLGDADVEKTLKLLTFLPLEQIAEVCAVEGAALREAKHLLAHELTRTVHGQSAADEAQQAAYALFGGGEGSREAMPTTELKAARLAERPTIVDVLVETELCASRGEARRLIGQGGAYLNDQRIDAIDHPVGPDAARDGEILLRAGKKRYHRIIVAD